jgi:hypothetical protein
MSEEKKTVFCEPTLEGKRFSAHTVPVEVLQEFVAFKDLIYATAKHLFFKNHAERKRLPKGFSKALGLELAAVKPGSAVAVLQRTHTTDDYAEFEQARDLVFDTIENANHGSIKEGLWPSHIINLFDPFGRTLEEDERLVFKTTANKKVEYNRNTRSKILSISRKPSQRAFRMLGRVSDVNLVSRKIQVVLEDESTIEGPLPEDFEAAIRDAHRSFESQDVLLVGMGTFGADMSLSKIDKVQHMVVYRDGKAFCIPDMAVKLEEIRSLKDGWLDGEGKAVSKKLVDATEKFFAQLNQSVELPFPYIYPTSLGQIQAEWSLGGWEVSAIFVSDEDMALHATEVSGNGLREDSFKWKETGVDSKLNEFFSALLVDVK